MNRATILTGGSAGLIAALLLAPATGTALGNLAQARAARDSAAAHAAAPNAPRQPLVRPADRLPGSSASAASRWLIDRVRGLAAGGGVLVEQAVPITGADGLVRVTLRLSGPDKALIALTDRIEREAPLVRLHRWNLVALEQGEARLEGELVAAWR